VRALTLADVQRVGRGGLKPTTAPLGLYLPTEAPQRAPAPASPTWRRWWQGYKGDAAAAKAEAFDATPANLDARTQHPASSAA
jgi:zinc protease